MHPTVMATLAAERHAELLQVAQARRAGRAVAPRRTTPTFLAHLTGTLRAVLPRPRLEPQPCCA